MSSQVECKQQEIDWPCTMQSLQSVARIQECKRIPLGHTVLSTGVLREHILDSCYSAVSNFQKLLSKRNTKQPTGI